jgi:hypothetical protein
VNEQVETEDRKEADTYAIVCLVLAVIAYPLACTIFGGALLLFISVILGIIALKDRTSKRELAIVGLVLDAFLCIIVGIVVYLLSTFGSVTVKETSVSPSGSYQVEVIANDQGATGGNYELYFQRSSEGKFASVGDKKPRDAEYISGTTRTWGTYYDIKWTSDDTFYVTADYVRVSGINLIKVELFPDTYQTHEGKVYLNRDESYFDHYEISGDKVFYVCYLNITNTFYEPIDFSLEAEDIKGQDGLLLDGHMVSADREGGEAVYSIGPGETETFEVVLCGDKGAKDERIEEELLPAIYLIPVSYYPNYEP